MDSFYMRSGWTPSHLLLFILKDDMGLPQIQKVSRIEAEILRLIEPEIQELGYQLWDLLWIPNQRILRVYISKPDLSLAITVDDCQRVSRVIDGVIEVSAILQDRYYLEVSSLGETPFIRTWVQLAHFKDQKLEFTDLEGKKRVGILCQVNHGGAFVWKPDVYGKNVTQERRNSHMDDYQRIRAKKSKE